MTLDSFMDDFGRDLHRAAAKPPRPVRRRRVLIAAPAAAGLAAVGVIALPRGDGVDAIAAARAALAPANDIVHMKIEMKAQPGQHGRIVIPPTEQWYSASLGRWRTKSYPNNARSPAFEQIISRDRVRMYDARKDRVTIYDGIKLPAGARVGIAGGDPATELRRQLDAGALRDDGVVTHDGREVRRLVRDESRTNGRFQQRFVYYMDPKTFAPIGGRMYFTVKGRPTFMTEFAISGYERIPLTAQSRALLRFPKTENTKYVWRTIKAR